MAKLERYQQNIGINGITKEAQEKLFSAKVAVIGAGALGSGVIMNLVGLGVGQIKIIDDDVVKLEDLNAQLIHRQKNISRAKVMSAKDWIQEYNDDVKVEVDKIKLNELNYFNILNEYNIIIDCLNCDETKYILNEIALRHKKILIHGSTQGFFGQVATIAPPNSACLACIKQKPEEFKEENFPLIAPVVSTISAIQSQEALKAIIGGCELLTNKLLTFDGYKSEFKTYECNKNIVCEVCGELN